MPTNRRRRKTQSRVNIEAALFYLAHGAWMDFLGPRIDDADELSDIWGEFGCSILVDHIKHYPGSRPAGWWSFDAPSERLRIVEGGPYPDYRHDGMHGIPPNCDAHEFESETTFLLRNNLLDPSESAFADRLRVMFAEGLGDSEIAAELGHAVPLVSQWREALR